MKTDIFYYAYHSLLRYRPYYWPTNYSGRKNEVRTNNEDIYEQIKAQSIQLSSLADMVESLQSQVKQLQETIRLRKHNKTSSVRKRSTSNQGTKTKKKTKRRGNAKRDRS